MSLKCYVYIPDRKFDFGCAGEHPVTITYSASVEYKGGTKRKNITIWSAVGQILFGEHLQHLDVVYKINESPAEREAWEDELFKDYMGMVERGQDLEEGA